MLPLEEDVCRGIDTCEMVGDSSLEEVSSEWREIISRSDPVRVYDNDVVVSEFLQREVFDDLLGNPSVLFLGGVECAELDDVADVRVRLKERRAGRCPSRQHHMLVLPKRSLF
ncbi:hypothetical protein D9M71_790850 [compost metagenome]